MRVLVMGSGGVGGYYGGLLARDGHDVTFVARGAHLAAMRANGLKLIDRGEELALPPVRLVEKPAESGTNFDLIFFTVKTYDTAPAAEAIRPAVGPDTAILPLQNGVGSIEALSEAVGEEHVLGGMTQIGVHIKEPGVVERFSPFCQVVLGEPKGGLSARAEKIAAALRNVGVDATATDDVQRALWEKFIMLAPLASMTSACNLMSGQVRSADPGRDLYLKLVDETAAVGRASGVNLPGESVEGVVKFFSNLPDTHTTSMQRDFDAKRRVELEELAGSVVRRGDALGVDTPRFDVIYAILSTRARSFGGVS
ncbi:MAG: 2-dehydropantoate 2-reductase [Chloroflexota bacterium]